MTPGVAAHRELELLNQAGIPAIEVLTIATRNAAQAVGCADDFGTIEVGKHADLVVLRQNPLEDITNSREIAWVIKDGHVLDPRDLMRDSE
jgi:imidazolonepropionase-like amidohydrolase